MKANQNIMLAAIGMVLSGAVTVSDAKSECERIAGELYAHESEALRHELTVMQQCVELFEAQEVAIKDFQEDLA